MHTRASVAIASTTADSGQMHCIVRTMSRKLRESQISSASSHQVAIMDLWTAESRPSAGRPERHVLRRVRGWQKAVRRWYDGLLGGGCEAMWLAELRVADGRLLLHPSMPPSCKHAPITQSVSKSKHDVRIERGSGAPWQAGRRAFAPRMCVLCGLVFCPGSGRARRALAQGLGAGCRALTSDEATEGQEVSL